MNKFSFVFFIIVTAFLSGCSDSAPSDVIMGVVKNAAMGGLEGLFIDEESLDYEVINEYTEPYDDKTLYVYEYEVTGEFKKDFVGYGGINGKKKGDTFKREGTMSLVKKGEKWYRVKSTIQRL